MKNFEVHYSDLDLGSFVEKMKDLEEFSFSSREREGKEYILLSFLKDKERKDKIIRVMEEIPLPYTAGTLTFERGLFTVLCLMIKNHIPIMKVYGLVVMNLVKGSNSVSNELDIIIDNVKSEDKDIFSPDLFQLSKVLAETIGDESAFHRVRIVSSLIIKYLGSATNYEFSLQELLNRFGFNN